MNLRFVSESLFGMATSVKINWWRKDESTRYDGDPALNNQLIHLSSSFSGRRQPADAPTLSCWCLKLSFSESSFHFPKMPAAPVEGCRKASQRWLVSEGGCVPEDDRG